jgi:hypothetical protein
MLRKISNFKHQKKFENQSIIMKFIYPRIAKYDFLREETLKKFMIKTDEKYGWASVFPKSAVYITVDFTNLEIHMEVNNGQQKLYRRIYSGR